MKYFSCILFIVVLSSNSFSQTLELPPRPANAPSGSAFINLIWSMPREIREEQIYSQVVSGNIPNFMRELESVTANANIGGTNHSVKYFVIPEYLAVGSDSDYFLCPMTPLLAQRICNALNCTLPTKKMVDQIYASAPCKLRPQPIPPTDQMITVPVFSQHNDSVKSLRFPLLAEYPLGTLVGGTKKDVIISNFIYQNLKANVHKPVVIYGWHQLNGVPIQTVYNGHGETYADYSHGIRLVLDSVIVDDTAMTFAQLLADQILCQLISDEGPILLPYYNLAGLLTPTPKSFGVEWDSPSSLKIYTNPTPIGTLSYKAFWGNDGIFFNDSTNDFTDEIIINNLPTDSIFFFKLRAQGSQGYSLFSEVLGAVPSSSKPEVIIVNGFDRGSSGNTNNFIRQHGRAFKQNGYSFCSTTNDAVLEGLISLQDYSIVDYILGDESTADESFNNAEQQIIKSYLMNGGNLFVSGSEIAWDLDFKGSSSDKDFIHNFLKSQYVNDAPNGQASIFYQAEPVANSIFDGIGKISFDNGTHGTINVRYPDVISGINGGINCLQYSNVTNQFAGVNFEGIFPGGNKNAKLVFVGFPFETIYPEEVRNVFLSKVISFFNSPVGISEKPDKVPESFQLFQNYPNPFNPITKIKYSIPNVILSEAKNLKDFSLQATRNDNSLVLLKVYDVLGSEAATLVNEYKPAGTYEVEFNAVNFPSGVYFYQLQVADFIETKKMLLMK
jgi:hypothetical protein